MTTPAPRPLHDLLVRHRVVAVVVAVLVLVLAAVPVGLAVTGAWSPQGTEESVSAGPGAGADSSEARGAPDASAPEVARDMAADVGTADAEALPAEPRVIRSAWLSVEVDDLSSAAAQVRAVADGVGGEVVRESLSLADAGTGPLEDLERGTASLDDEGGLLPPGGSADTAVLTLRVPTERVGVTLDRLAEVGTLVRRTSSAEDVTQSYVDTTARVETMRAAVARLRALLADADGLEEVILLEGELTRRTAELESLEQRLADLDRRTSTADVTIVLTGPSGGADDAPGYWASLWGHLLGSAQVILVGLAVLLPWVALGALVVLVVALVRRRGAARRQDHQAPPGEAS